MFVYTVSWVSGNAKDFAKGTDTLSSFLQGDCIKQTSISVSGGNHNHTGTTGNVSGSGDKWNHSHISGILVQNEQASTAPWGSWSSANGIRSGQETNGTWKSPLTSNSDLQHTHSIPSSGDLSMSGTIGSGNTETRPKNYTARIWKRIA